ncbi:unnamed protein product [Heligmosomoides polygyrus]|uniref:SOCS box domain-containing protein n=1 Tax=Heligmosomoides polygyrus TaxID=6339 RepID=A0A183FB45_HELPZ|nr:unnamed protein product [Heligmosomoides polygyrus]
MLLYQEAGGVNGINGATASHEAALITGKLDDVTNSSIDNSFKDLHAVRKQANRTVIRAVCRTALLLPNRYRRTFAPTLRDFLLRHNLIEEPRQPLSRVAVLGLP